MLLLCTEISRSRYDGFVQQWKGLVDSSRDVAAKPSDQRRLDIDPTLSHRIYPMRKCRIDIYISIFNRHRSWGLCYLGSRSYWKSKRWFKTCFTHLWSVNKTGSLMKPWVCSVLKNTDPFIFTQFHRMPRQQIYQGENNIICGNRVSNGLLSP